MTQQRLGSQFVLRGQRERRGASGKKSVGRSVKTADDVDASLRSHAQMAVESLTDSAPYAPDADMEDNTHLEADLDELLDAGLLEELGKGSGCLTASTTSPDESTSAARARPSQERNVS